MHHQTLGLIFPGSGALRGVDDEIFVDAARHTPADNLAREEVGAGRQVEPSLLGGDVGDVPALRLVAGGC